MRIRIWLVWLKVRRMAIVHHRPLRSRILDRRRRIRIFNGV